VCIYEVYTKAGLLQAYTLLLLPYQLLFIGCFITGQAGILCSLEKKVCHQGYSQVAGLQKGHQFGCSIQSLFLYTFWGEVVSPSFQVLVCNLVMAGGSFSTYSVCNHLLPSIAGEEPSLFTGGMVTEWNQAYVYYDCLLTLNSCRELQGSGAVVISKEILIPLIWQSWAQELVDHPDPKFTDFILSGIRHGFCIGFHCHQSLNFTVTNH